MIQGNEQKLEFYPFQAFSDDSLVPLVIFYDSQTALCLDRMVHLEKCSVDALQVVKDFPVESRQFFVEPNRPVFSVFLH